MARVSIEERAAAGAKRLARMMGWTRTETIGRLYFLWHDSQELEQTHCIIDDLSVWMDLEVDEESKIVEALIKSGFLEEVSSGEFLICGNEKHIENLKQRREAASEGGKRSAEARAAKSKDQVRVQPNAQANASSEIQANGSNEIQANASTETQASDEPCSLQFSALKENTIVENSFDEINKTPPKRKNRKQEYSDEFNAAYKVYPRQEGKSAGYRIYLRSVTTSEDQTLLLQAIKNYCVLCKKENREKKHIKNFGTFMGCWRDYENLHFASHQVDSIKAEQIKQQSQQIREQTHLKKMEMLRDFAE